jgi:hypothetical protein
MALCQFEGGGEQVAAEDHVRVLVVGDLRQHPVADQVAGGAGGVAVVDPGGQFLAGVVGHRVQRRVPVVGDEAAARAGHARAFQRHRVHMSRVTEV